MASVAALYTPEVLMLATGLVRHRWDDGLALQGAARSPSCGSTMKVGIDLAADGRIARIGLAAQACAIGQAAGAIMADAAIGRSQSDFADAEADILRWLAEGGDLPDWPGLGAIAPAREFPGRHGAILLGWRAVLQAFSSFAKGEGEIA
ncbi:NifU-like protein involved in Fe-S cluster formation [Novosphingobium sp. SG751A]|uniref:iron-sulfur cluster assembly scaffold protein n=1 Tax=Novosphingobium sp. SG751A TaxID=2587000 RepID=UPI0015556530|nr:iron-sulfur cluster assembly scaffold protein [Novosphingobium sp. SG751A]NOW44299.1 NifU-like protein involved in Fe-S cluster formation [Novosphingobium sp. SG751A]